MSTPFSRFESREPSIDGLFDRARRLEESGDDVAAREAYLGILNREPKHLATLLKLGNLLIRTGFRSAGGTVLEEAVKQHPESAAAHAGLAGFLADEDRPDLARSHAELALGLDPELAQAHQTLAVLLLRAGDADGARQHGRVGFGGRAEVWPYRGSGRPVRVLVLYSALGGNVGVERFLDDRIFEKISVVTEFFDPQAELPPHDVVFNAIGDADRCGAALEAANVVLARTLAPVVNPPSDVLLTGRLSMALRLARIPGVVAAKVASFARERLLEKDGAAALERAGLDWPLLVRSPGFHTGLHFVKVDTPADLAAALEDLPGPELLAISFIDARSVDGKVRKYRVMLIDGALMPLHVAVSEDWKVHYMTADMAENAEHRAEDAAFLADMRGVLGAHGLAALQRVAMTLGLHYAGIDFSIGPANRLIVFEANATMVVPEPEPDPRWDYRRGPVERIHAAARAMLIARAGRTV